MKQVTEKRLDIYDGRYSINTNGDMFSNNYRNSGKRQKLKQYKSNQGYLNVCLMYSEKDAKPHFIHRLVALAFIPLIEGKNIVNHINEIKQDNRVENLEWTDYYGNWHHSFDNYCGENAPCARLTNTQAEEIREQKSNGVKSAVLEEKYNVSQPTVSRIFNNKIYCKK